MTEPIALKNTFKIQKISKPKNNKNLSREDMEIVCMLEKLKKDLDVAHSSLNQVLDPILIDSCIFEINAINMRYKYYLNISKERDLIADGFN